MPPKRSRQESAEEEAALRAAKLEETIRREISKREKARRRKEELELKRIEKAVREQKTFRRTKPFVPSDVPLHPFKKAKKVTFEEQPTIIEPVEDLIIKMPSPDETEWTYLLPEEEEKTLQQEEKVEEFLKQDLLGLPPSFLTDEELAIQEQLLADIAREQKQFEIPEEEEEKEGKQEREEEEERKQQEVEGYDIPFPPPKTKEQLQQEEEEEAAFWEQYDIPTAEEGPTTTEDSFDWNEPIAPYLYTNLERTLPDQPSFYRNAFEFMNDYSNIISRPTEELNKYLNHVKDDPTGRNFECRYAENGFAFMGTTFSTPGTYWFYDSVIFASLLVDMFRRARANHIILPCSRQGMVLRINHTCPVSSETEVMVHLQHNTFAVPEIFFDEGNYQGETILRDGNPTILKLEKGHAHPFLLGNEQLFANIICNWITYQLETQPTEYNHALGNIRAVYIYFTDRNRKANKHHFPQRKDYGFPIEHAPDEWNYTGYCEMTRGKVIFKHGYLLHTVKGKNGSCFFQVVNLIMKRYQKGSTAARLMKKINYEQEGVPVEKIEELCSQLKINLTVHGFLENGILYNMITTRLEDTPMWGEMVYDEGHYFLFIGKAVKKWTPKGFLCKNCFNYHKSLQHRCNKIPCQNCGTPINPNNISKHKCVITSCNWKTYQHSKTKLGKQHCVANIQYIRHAPDVNNFIIYDLETHLNDCYTEDEPETKYKHVPYSCGWKYQGVFHCTYGYNCVELFLRELEKLQLEKCVVLGYNNSGYDNHFIIKKLIEMSYTNLQFIMHGGGNIINMVWNTNQGTKYQFLDIYRFIMDGSLKSNCIDFGITIRKGAFPYRFLNKNKDIYYIGDIPSADYWEELPTTYDANEKNWNLKDENIKYLQQDVECTYELFNSLISQFYIHFHIDMTKFITLSHLTYELWLSFITLNRQFKTSNEWFFPSPRPTLYNNIPLVLPSADQYVKIVSATYGGRCYPWRKRFISKHYEAIKEGKMTYNELQNDYLIAWDVVSLYAAAMMENEYPFGSCFELSEEEILRLNESLVNMRKYTMAIYYIRYSPNKKLLTPILPSKEVKWTTFGKSTSKGLSWTLEDGMGWYTSVDVEEAIKYGYKITFLEGIYWSQKSKLFYNYMNILFNIKKNAELEKNNTLRNIAKLLANSLYGKMLQKIITEEAALVTNFADYQHFTKNKIITDIVPYSWEENQSNKHAAIFKGHKVDFETSINKPTALGAFILSYSRKIMNNYFDITDPHRLTSPEASFKNMPFYTDTDSFYLQMDENKYWDLMKYISEDGSRIGFIKNDEKKFKSKIIKAYFVNPKCYMVEYLGKRFFIFVLESNSLGCGLFHLFQLSIRDNDVHHQYLHLFHHHQVLYLLLLLKCKWKT